MIDKGFCIEVWCMKKVRWLREEPKSYAFLFYFILFIYFLVLFFYHAFIVLRYKKLRGVLAKERTKSINQSIHKRNHNPESITNLKTTWLRPFANALAQEKQYMEVSTSNSFFT